MSTQRRMTLATGCLALVLTAGCTDTTEPEEADAAAPAGDAVTFETLTGDTTRLTLDDGVTEALSAVGVEVTATGGAEVETSGGTTTFVFPVSGGAATVDPDGAERFAGEVEHDGGLQFSALGRTATADELVLDGEQLTAVVGDRRLPLVPLVTDPEITVDGDDSATVSYSASTIDTSTDGSLGDQLQIPSLPGLDVTSLETTLEGS